MTNPAIVTGPTVWPVSLSEAKDHLRVDVTADDILIDSLVKAATRHCERLAMRSFITQTLDLVLDAWPSTVFWLPRPPIQSVTSITYVDEDGNSDTVSSDDYLVDTAFGRIALKRDSSWPSATLQRIGGVTIRYVAGFGDARADVPHDFKQAILLVAGDWYENRENMLVGTISSSIDFGVKALLDGGRTFPMARS